MKKPLLAVAAIAVLLTLTVACGGSKDIANTDKSTSTSPSTTSLAETTAPETSPAPTTPSVTFMSPTNDGKTLTGEGYSISIPDGWEDITASLQAKNPALDIAIGESASSGFRTNFNIVHPTPTPATVQNDAAELHKEAAAELKTVTHATVSSLPDTTIDGEPAIGQTSKFTSAGIPITFLQYIAIHDGKAYPVTMTSATSQLADAKATLVTILASWHWES